MYKRILVVIACGLPAGALLAQDGYFGVYVLPQSTASVDGEIVAFVPRSELRFEVAVANEEGGEELFLADGIAGSLALELRRDGEPLPASTLALSWAQTEERYAIYGDLPPEPRRAGVLEPEVGLKSELSVRRRDGATFGPGRYELRLTVSPGAVRGPGGEPWSGRGGLGGAGFTLRTAEKSADRILERKLEASETFGRGDYELAAALWAEIVAADETDNDGWSGLGASLFHLGQYARAAGCLEKVMPEIVAKGLHSSLPFLLAESYVVLGEQEKAAEALRIVVVEPQVKTRLEQIRKRLAQRPAPEQ